MWHFISEQISQERNIEFICDDARQISGGDSHQAFRIADGKHRFFVKVNHKSNLDQLEAEVQGLIHLAQPGCIRTPQVICTGTVADHAFLVLEYISLNDGDEHSWYAMGQQLAQLHRQSPQQMYGWQDDNFIGPTPQPNQWHKKWCSFFAEQRIGYMLQLLAEKGQALASIDHTVDAVVRLLAGHHPEPSPLHGDLWRGNVGFHKQQPILFDPAFYHGDRETDIAMTELFGAFPNAFYQGYESSWPLDDGYQFRKPVYQLYHLLNHVLLFGEQYLPSAKATLSNLDN